MAPLRYRRTSLRTLLGITTEEKKIKRELGITAILKPFRWWGNEKRSLKRDVGYYSPEARFARQEFPRAGHKLLIIAALVIGIPFALGWWFKSASNQAPAAKPAVSTEWPSAASAQPSQFR